MAGDKEAETSSSKIKLDCISTDTAAENFAEMLDEKKTFFLNGSWGSGKTEFLRNTNNHSNKTFKYLKLWEVKDYNTVILLSFRKLLPKIFFLSIVLLIIGSSLTIDNIKNFDIDFYENIKKFKIFTPKMIGFMIVIIFGVFKLLSIRLDDVYVAVLDLFPNEEKYYSRNFWINIAKKINFIFSFLYFFVLLWAIIKISFYFDCKKFIFMLMGLFLIISDYAIFRESVLIIDDFDRIPGDRQKEAYMVFNLLKNKIPIVVVGDYAKVVKSEDRYLQKIINTHVDLPYALHPSNIWDDYFKKLSKEIGIIILDDFRKIVISEKRNLREREQFNDYITKEFFEKGKVWYLQTEQLLWIIYAFVFHRSYYNKLVDGTKFDLSEAIIANREYHESSFDDNIKSKGVTNKLYPYKLSDEDILRDELDRIQNYDNKRYPRCFKLEKQKYLIHEAPLNLSVSELKSIVEDDEKLKDYISSGSHADFYEYLVSENDSPLLKNNEMFLDLSLDLIKEGKHSSSIDYIIHKSNNELMRYRTLKNNELFEKWKPRLKKHGFDLSEMFYFFNRNYILSFQDMGKLFPNNTDILKGSKRLDHSLNVYISSRKLWRQFKKWDDKIWAVIKSLSDEQFLSFWVFQGLISNGSNDFYSIPDDKKYVIFYEEHPHPKLLPNSDIISHRETINKVSRRLSDLERKGYSFVYEKGVYYE